MAVLDQVAVGVAHADPGRQGHILAPAHAEDGTGLEAVHRHGHQRAPAGGDIAAGEELLHGLHISGQHRDLRQLGQEEDHQRAAQGSRQGAAEEDDPALFPAAQGQHQQQNGDQCRQQLAPAAQDHHAQQQKCQGQAVQEDGAAAPGPDRQIAAAGGHAQEEDIVRIAVGSQTDAVAQGGEEIIVPPGSLAEDGVDQLQKQHRHQGEDDDEGGHCHGPQIHDPVGPEEPVALCLGADGVAQAEDHADLVGEGVRVVSGPRQEEVEEDHQPQDPGTQGDAGGVQGFIALQAAQQMDGQQKAQEGIAEDHPVAEVPVEEEGHGEEGQHGLGPVAEGKIVPRFRDPAPELSTEGAEAAAQSLQEAADGVREVEALQPQGGPLHQHRHGVEAPEDHALEIGVEDAQKQQKGLDHKGADAEDPGQGLAFRGLQPVELAADEGVGIEQGGDQEGRAHDAGLREELQVDAVDVLHILAVEGQKFLGDQGVELVPADAEEGIFPEGIEGQGVKLHPARGNVLALEELLDGHHIADQGLELPQPGEQGDDDGDGGDAAENAGDDQNAAELRLAQGQHQQHDAGHRAQKLAPSAHQHQGHQEGRAQSQCQAGAPVKPPGGGIGAAHGNAQIEDVVGIGAAAQGDGVAPGDIVAQVQLGRLGQGVEEALPEQPGEKLEEQHEGGHEDRAAEAQPQGPSALPLSRLRQNHKGAADQGGDNKGNGIGIVAGIGPEEIQENRGGQHQKAQPQGA